MSRSGFLYRLRTAITHLFGVSSEDARHGRWWEVDLLLVVLLGAFILGAIAWIQIESDPAPANRQVRQTDKK
jgi:hypothetical protein